MLQDLSFTAAAGSITVLLGPNGAGKSTALKCILGLLPYQGEVTLGGQPAARAGAARPGPAGGLRAPALVAGRAAAGAGRGGPGPLRPRGRQPVRPPVADPSRRRSRRRWRAPICSRWPTGRSPRCLTASAGGCCWRAPWPRRPAAAAGRADGGAGRRARAAAAGRRCGDRPRRDRGGDGAAPAAGGGGGRRSGACCWRRGAPWAREPSAEVIAPGPVRAVYGVEMIPGGAVRLPAARRRARRSGDRTRDDAATTAVNGALLAAATGSGAGRRAAARSARRRPTAASTRWP